MKKLLSIVALGLYSLSVPVLAERLDFDVYLDNQSVGFNTVNINHSGAETQVSVKSVFNVKLLFVNVYHYSHTAQERWRNGCLVQLNTRTNDNGKQQTVTTTQAGNILKVNAGGNSADLQGCTRSFAYWNPALLNSSHLLNTQTGQYERVHLASSAASHWFSMANLTAVNITGCKSVAIHKSICGTTLIIVGRHYKPMYRGGSTLPA
ncbi:MAG: DUF6134 family protein [Thiolinea sp.]